jgi:hypothetical protein
MLTIFVRTAFDPLRHAVYLLYWHKRTNTDTDDTASGNLSARRQASASADVCSRMLTYVVVC